RELLHHYRDWLTRAHGFTGFALLLFLAMLGLSQHYGYVAVTHAALPTSMAVTAMLVLATFAGLALLAVAAATEPLLSTIARLPVERLDIALLQTVVAFAKSTSVRPGSGLPESFASVLERLVVVLENGRDSLRETISRLSENAESLTVVATAMSQR